MIRQILAGIAIVGSTIIGPTLLGACNVRPYRSSMLEYKSRSFPREIDPVNYSAYLREGEYAVPDDVIDTYAGVVDTTEQHKASAGPLATYVDFNRLNTPEKKLAFKVWMETIGYDDDAINTFYTILSTKGNIILKESLLRTSVFERALLHERMHRELETLTEEKWDKIVAAYTQLKEVGCESQSQGFCDRIEYQGVAAHAVNNSIEEFFPYLAQGALEESVEKALQKYFPDAYMIFDDLRVRSSLGNIYNEDVTLATM